MSHGPSSTRGPLRAGLIGLGAVGGHFGRLEIRLENTPSVNPKTGRLVAPSVVRALRRYREPLVIGA